MLFLNYFLGKNQIPILFLKFILKLMVSSLLLFKVLVPVLKSLHEVFMPICCGSEASYKAF